MNVPGPWEGVLLALAAFRVWRLISVDEILNGPRHALLRLGWRWADGDPVPKSYREKWAIFLECPWCMGFWVSLAWWGAFQFSEHVTLVVATPFVVSAAVGLIRSTLDPPEE